VALNLLPGAPGMTRHVHTAGGAVIQHQAHEIAGVKLLQPLQSVVRMIRPQINWYGRDPGLALNALPAAQD
jgi:hypothetical protein